MFYVYILRCRGGSLYTGYTNNTGKRLRMHKEGKASKYTRSRLPVRLLAEWQFATKSEAMKYEAAFKGLSRKEKLAAVEESSGLSRRLR